MSKQLTHHRLVLAIVLAALCAASDAIDIQLCLGLDAAIQAEAGNVVICAFPRPSYPSSSPTEVPVACHRKATEIIRLLRAASGFEGLQDASKVCYMKVQPDNHQITVLNLDLIKSQYAEVPNSRKIKLLESAAEIVGISPALTIYGPISSLDPALFTGTGAAQRDKLEFLFLVSTALQSFDLGLFEPLKIKELLLVNNPNLTQMTNNKDVQLPNLKDFVLWNNNPSLVDCRNLLSLPASLQQVTILQDGFKDSCAQCHLPKSCQKLLVRQEEENLKYFPGVSATFQPLPFPLARPYGSGTFFPSPVVVKMFDLSSVSANAACKSECPCQKWPPPVDSTKNSAATDGGAVSGTSSGSASGASSGTSSGTGSGAASGSSSGTGTVRQSLGNTNSCRKIWASTVMVAIASILRQVLSWL